MISWWLVTNQSNHLSKYLTCTPTCKYIYIIYIYIYLFIYLFMYFIHIHYMYTAVYHPKRHLNPWLPLLWWGNTQTAILCQLEMRMQNKKCSNKSRNKSQKRFFPLLQVSNLNIFSKTSAVNCQKDDLRNRLSLFLRTPILTQVLQRHVTHHGSCSFSSNKKWTRANKGN